MAALRGDSVSSALPVPEAEVVQATCASVVNLHPCACWLRVEAEAEVKRDARSLVRARVGTAGMAARVPGRMGRTPSSMHRSVRSLLAGDRAAIDLSRDWVAMRVKGVPFSWGTRATPRSMKLADQEVAATLKPVPLKALWPAEAVVVGVGSAAAAAAGGQPER